MDTVDSYVIREARTDDEPALVALLVKHYFPNEYVNMIYFEKIKHKIDDVEKKNIALDAKDKFAVLVARCPCLVAVHNETKTIVGISLMKTNTEVDSCTVKISSIHWRSDIFVHLTSMIGAPDCSVDLFAEFPLHRTALRLLYLCVHPEHSGHGLATRLIKGSIDYAKNKAFGLIYGMFTSPFSQKAAKKNGLEKFREFDILTLRDKNKDVVFQGTEPHMVPWMIKQIQFINASN